MAKLHVETHEHEDHQPEQLWEQLESQRVSEGKSNVTELVNEEGQPRGCFGFSWDCLGVSGRAKRAVLGVGAAQREGEVWSRVVLW